MGGFCVDQFGEINTEKCEQGSNFKVLSIKLEGYKTLGLFFFFKVEGDRIFFYTIEIRLSAF